ncbi:MAG: betaine--homocysteine S-methyltransferase [Rhodospirillales bacterium]|nr:betaine--homocysteine S-methyltransferase [Rhodospirillales bacterium]MDH3912092.1 betaine--homocysteine S-methyltransferase [Rhodospirillales bacterium]MDH3918006.1 betaine--homocysteine S-methyltransferase [Rhodospirillales bacterium]MDH3969270.1 betaine--homocysteine S-methyltransferase [Rhodospirillales bacterium]
MPDRLTRLLAERPWLLADGATGTNYFALGLETGDAPELWNLQYPERVGGLHRAFIEAGSDLILTNSFGGTRHRLKLHEAQDRVAEINRAAARLAREAADGAGREVVVAGSMGPTGEILAPIGPLSGEDAADAFAEQAAALAEGGADLLWIETMSSVEELSAAVEGGARTGLPLATTLSFDTNGRTMMGVTPAQVVQLVHGLTPRPAAYGGNCGTGPAELMAAIVNLRAAGAPEDVLIAKSNCGIPEYVEGEIIYSGTPELMADYARLALDAGVRIIGGCCGTTPQHIAVMRAALESHTPGEPPTLEQIVARLGPITSGAVQQGILGARPDAEPTDREKRRARRRRGKTGGGEPPRF